VPSLLSARVNQDTNEFVLVIGLGVDAGYIGIVGLEGSSSLGFSISSTLPDT